MSRLRIDLQPAKNISADARQPGNEAAMVGNATSGIAFVNVFKVQSAGVVTFSLETATDVNLGDAVSNNFWGTAGSIVIPTTGPSVQKITLTDLASAIRWRVAGVTSEFAFSCVVYLSDE